MPREANNQKQEDISPSPSTSPASEYNKPASPITQTQIRKLSSSDNSEESHPSKRVTRSPSVIQESSSSEKMPSSGRPSPPPTLSIENHEMPREANNQKQEDISPSPFTSPASEYNNPASLTTQTQKRKLSSSDKPEESHPSKRITRSQSAIQESSSSEKTPSPERPMRSRFLNPRMRPPTPPTLRREEKRVTWGVPDSPDQDAANVESPMRESETMRRCRDFNCKFVLYQGEYLCQGKCGEMSRKSMNALNLMSGSIEAHTNFIQQLETLALTLLENKSTRDDRRKYLWKAGNEIKNELPRHREELDKRVKTMQQLRSVCM